MSHGIIYTYVWACIRALNRRYLDDDSDPFSGLLPDRIFWKKALKRWWSFLESSKFGPIFGAALGLLPQCGFSVLAAMLYLQKNITLGTMIAVFIATSDEAIPILISEPQLIPSLMVLLVLKFILAAAAGYLTDKVLVRHQHVISFNDLPEDEEEEDFEEDQNDVSSCPCCYPQYPMWLSVTIRHWRSTFYLYHNTSFKPFDWRNWWRKSFCNPFTWFLAANSSGRSVWFYSKLCRNSRIMPAVCFRFIILCSFICRSMHKCWSGLIGFLPI